MNLVEIREKLAAKLREHADLIDKYPDRDWPDEVEQTLHAQKKELDDLAAQVNKLAGRQAFADGLTDLKGLIDTPVNAPPHAGAAPDVKGQARFGRLSDQVLNDPEWKSWMKSAAFQGQFNSKTRIQSPAVEIKTLLTGASATSVGAMIFNDQIPELVPNPRRPLVLRDVVTVAQTDSDTVEYVRVNAETNNAAAVAEATATGDGSGAKPESAATFTNVTTNVVNIAHWIPITRRALADAGQMRAYIDDFLRYGVNQELEDQMMEGTGGNGLVGISQTTGIQTYTTTGNLLTAVRKAKTLVKTVAFDEPNAIVMAPEDWEVFDLLQDNEARYYFGGPVQMMAPRMFGLPVIECQACTTGFAYVGNFKRAVLWDREQANIQVSDSHSDFFVRNMIALLGELRAAFSVIKPNSIVQVDLTS